MFCMSRTKKEKNTKVSITKSSIVIGSPRAYLSRNQQANTSVSNCVRFELFQIGHLLLDTHVIFTSITRALMASYAMFSTVFKT